MKNLHVLYTNVDTLTEVKKSLIEALIEKCPPDIICLSEVAPKHSLYPLVEENLILKGYNLFHEGFKNRGVCIYVQTR